MNGLELSKLYYETYGKAMLDGFPQLKPFIAVGLAGSGSECLGFDDEVSQDHDFEPGFCIFLPGEDIVSRREEFLLQRAYDKLPKEFMGFSRSIMIPAGGRRRGVIRTAGFFEKLTGTSRFEFPEPDAAGRPDPSGAPGAFVPLAPMSNEQWLSLPEEYLLEAVSGEVFFDNYGEVTAIRSYLAYFPEDIRLKKIAGALMMMSQSGLYNYGRCLAHGEKAAAQMAIAEFVERAVHLVYLLNQRYMPYYKWWFRGMRDLPVLGSLSETLEDMLLDPFGMKENGNTGSPGVQTSRMEKVIQAVTAELRNHGLSDETGVQPEKHAQSVNSRIRDVFLRNADLLISE